MELTNSRRAGTGAGDLLPGTYSEESVAMVDSRVEHLQAR
jgi:hypothetical protein